MPPRKDWFRDTDCEFSLGSLLAELGLGASEPHAKSLEGPEPHDPHIGKVLQPTFQGATELGTAPPPKPSGAGFGRTWKPLEATFQGDGADRGQAGEFQGLAPTWAVPLPSEQRGGHEAPKLLGVLSDAFDGLEGEFGSLTPEGNRGAHLGQLSARTISEFAFGAKGVDTTTSDSLTMLHDQDSVLLKNPYPDETAYFKITTTWTKKKKNIWGKPGDKVDEGVDTKDVVLKYNESLPVVNYEGQKDEKGLFKDFFYNRDTAITLIKVDKVVKVTDPSTGQTTTQVVTESTGGGGGLPMSTSTSDALKYGAAAVGVAAVAGAGYYLLTKDKKGE